MKGRSPVVSIPLLCVALPSLLIAQDASTHARDSFWKRGTLTGDWGGARSRWADDGVEFGLEYTGEFLADVGGGVRRAGLYQHLVKTRADFDLEKAVGWKEGRFHVSSLWLWGTRPDDIAGLTGSAYLDPSNISGYDTYRLYELWLEQGFFEGRLSARVGQIALDEEFLCSDYGGVFISGTHGWPAFVSATIPNGGPAYPVAGTGVRFRVRPVESCELLAAVMGGNVRDQATENRHGTDFCFDSSEGVLSIVELIYRLNERGDTALPGTYRLGGWFHSGRFADMRYDRHGLSLEDDGTLSGEASDGIPASHSGDGGFYLDMDQMIWRERAGSDEGLGMYCRVAPWLPADRNPLTFYAAGGLTYRGLIPGRTEDILGVGASYAQVSERLRGAQQDANRVAAAGGTPNQLAPGPLPDYELDLEITWQIHLSPWWSLQPDFQYIFHPGGSGATADAIVIGVRSAVVF